VAVRREALAKRRRARGLSQEQLAERLAVDRSTVGRWERGDADPVPWIRPFLAQALEITLDDLDILLASVEMVPAEDMPTPLSAGEATSAFFADSARRALAFTTTFASPVHAFDIDALSKRVACIANAYLMHPLDDVVPEVQALRTESEQLLRSPQRPYQSPDLLVILARALALLANAAMDAGEHAAAHSHAEAAVRVSSAAGHSEVTAWARGLQASNAFWAGDHAGSARLASEALPTASQGTTAVFLACLLARASGRIGDHRAVARALGWAERARDRATNDEIGGVFTFSDAKQHLYAATAHLGAGGDPVRALASAQMAVSQYAQASSPSFGDESGARMDVATAYLRLGEPDGAIEALEPVLGLPSNLRVATIRTRLKRVRGELVAAYGDLPAARDAIERIDTLQSDAPAL
jgi:transcriptional regulator with XRE-family HTH domain